MARLETPKKQTAREKRIQKATQGIAATAVAPARRGETDEAPAAPRAAEGQ